MRSTPPPQTRPMTIVAQDPSVRVGNHIVTAEVEVPAEVLDMGPRGYRVHVIDYDTSTRTLYRPGLVPDVDPFGRRGSDNRALVSNPAFHARNVYAIVMCTLARFEFALGRRVSWAFDSHQLNVVPHGFADANAFYSRRDHALLFGYFPARNGKEIVYSCLAHDVVAHETTHALLDGLRSRYTDPSSPDQAAFHEAFADIVALLSVFALREIVETLIDQGYPGGGGELVPIEFLGVEGLKKSALFGLAEQMGQELKVVRGEALRRSAELEPSRAYLRQAEFEEPHRRGEVLVAAVLNAVLRVWARRLSTLGQQSPGYLNRSRVAEEGRSIADYLLTMMIRALDYAPPVDITFSDFLSALLTADVEIRPDDSKFGFRKELLASFCSYGIDVDAGEAELSGVWKPPTNQMIYDRTHFESLQHDPDEVFRFLWENRKKLDLCEDAYSRVLSVRPCLRIGPDGFWLRETVAEYYQTIKLTADELSSLGVRKPAGMSGSQEIDLYGGGALVFDERGRLKFHVQNRIMDRERQSARLQYLWDYGAFNEGASALRRFSNIHRQRATSWSQLGPDSW